MEVGVVHYTKHDALPDLISSVCENHEPMSMFRKCSLVEETESLDLK